MQKEDVPPEHLWEDSEGLEQWWKYIEDKRSDGRSDDATANRLKRSSSEEGQDDDDHEPGMAENELARHLK